MHPRHPPAADASAIHVPGCQPTCSCAIPPTSCSEPVDKESFLRNLWWCFDTLAEKAGDDSGKPAYFRFLTLLGACCAGPCLADSFSKFRTPCCAGVLRLALWELTNVARCGGRHQHQQLMRQLQLKSKAVRLFPVCRLQGVSGEEGGCGHPGGEQGCFGILVQRGDAEHAGRAWC